MVRRSVFRHAAAMAGKNIRAYAMLSVTIVLSFSLLLGYFVLTDSTLYHKHKKALALDPGVIRLQYGAASQSAYELLTQEMDKMENTHYYSVYHSVLSLFDRERTDQNGNYVNFPAVQVYSIPRHIWELRFQASDSSVAINWLDGKAHEEVDLRPGEVLMDLHTFRALGLDQLEQPVYTFQIRESGVKLTIQARIVGTFTNSVAFSCTEYEDRTDLNYMPMCVFSMADLNPVQAGLDWSAGLLIHTDTPVTLYERAQGMGFDAYDAAYLVQNSARKSIQNEIKTKAVIAAAMLLILGINLYSSFSNALNDRKFEIGVKRAIGASGWVIVRQFLYESILVMAANILLSIWLVTAAGLVYKVINEHIPDSIGQYHTFTLYISPHSALMFGVCAVGLTVVFSLIFGYKSTQVQVIDHLKSE